MTLCSVAHQAPLSMGLSRQEYWSGLPCPAPGDLPGPGIKLMSPVSPALQANSGEARIPLSQPLMFSSIANITPIWPRRDCMVLR